MSAFGDWGEDYNDSSQYCRHGVFVGTPYGPDYMCHYCESGTEPPPPPTHKVQFFGATGCVLHTEYGTRDKLWSAGKIPMILRQSMFAGICEHFRIALCERRGDNWVTVDVA